MRVFRSVSGRFLRLICGSVTLRNLLALLRNLTTDAIRSRCCEGVKKVVACSNARVLMLDPGAQPRSPGLLRGNRPLCRYMLIWCCAGDSSPGPSRSRGSVVWSSLPSFYVRAANGPYLRLEAANIAQVLPDPMAYRRSLRGSHTRCQQPTSTTPYCAPPPRTTHRTTLNHWESC